MPRFGHGAFLLCLENLYKKVTGRDMIYTALIGKPSEITYRHAEHVLQQQVPCNLLLTEKIMEISYFQAVDVLGMSNPVKNIYCIGDNVCTDIFGANLYNNYLHKRRLDSEMMTHAKMQDQSSRSIDKLIGTTELSGAQACYSVLVETG